MGAGRVEQCGDRSAELVQVEGAVVTPGPAATGGHPLQQAGRSPLRESAVVVELRDVEARLLRVAFHHLVAGREATGTRGAGHGDGRVLGSAPVVEEPGEIYQGVADGA